MYFGLEVVGTDWYIEATGAENGGCCCCTNTSLCGTNVQETLVLMVTPFCCVCMATECNMKSYIMIVCGKYKSSLDCGKILA